MVDSSGEAASGETKSKVEVAAEEAETVSGQGPSCCIEGQVEIGLHVGFRVKFREECGLGRARQYQKETPFDGPAGLAIASVARG